MCNKMVYFITLKFIKLKSTEFELIVYSPGCTMSALYSFIYSNSKKAV